MCSAHIRYKNFSNAQFYVMNDKNKIKAFAITLS